MPVSRASPKAAKTAIDILIVDDSAVVRTLMAGWLHGLAWARRVETAPNGQDAIEAVRRSAPDVIVLDLDMPGIDGLWLIPRLMRHAPDAAIIVCSGLARNGSLVAIECLYRGAKDIVPKPSARKADMESTAFRDDLLTRIRVLGGLEGAAAPPAAAPPPVPLRRRFVAARPPDAILIGASTGGPQALQDFLIGLAPVLARVPVVVAQHVPAAFAQVLANYFRVRLNLAISVPASGEVLRPGRVLLAPGGADIRIEARDGRAVVRLEQVERRGNAPSVDILFETAAAIFGPALAGVVLSGMGDDGLAGARAIRKAGGLVFAQDQTTSVVWGMPGAVAGAGLAALVAPPADLADRIVGLFAAGERHVA